jgi:hypothetical protein
VTCCAIRVSRDPLSFFFPATTTTRRQSLLPHVTPPLSSRDPAAPPRLPPRRLASPPLAPPAVEAAPPSPCLIANPPAVHRPHHTSNPNLGVTGANPSPGATVVAGPHAACTATGSATTSLSHRRPPLHFPAINLKPPQEIQGPDTLFELK